MKKNIFLLLLCLTSIMTFAQADNSERSSEQDIPFSERPKYIEYALDMITVYYRELPYTIENPMRQIGFIERLMYQDNPNYMPEFLPVFDEYTDFLEPKQYMLELDKTFSDVDTDGMRFIIRNFHINLNDFFNHGRIGLRVLATYDLEMFKDENRIFTRTCEAFCVFPIAKHYLNVKLFQVRPLDGDNFRIIDKTMDTQTEEDIPTDNATAEKEELKIADSALDSNQPKDSGFSWPNWLKFDVMTLVLAIIVFIFVFVYHFNEERRYWRPIWQNVLHLRYILDLYGNTVLQVGVLSLLYTIPIFIMEDFISLGMYFLGLSVFFLITSVRKIRSANMEGNIEGSIKKKKRKFYSITTIVVFMIVAALCFFNALVRTMADSKVSLSVNNNDPWSDLANGVYAVSADGKLVEVDDADNTCIAVALIAGEHKFMIEKNGEKNTTSIKADCTADGADYTDYTNFYWGIWNSDVSGITNYYQVGGGSTAHGGFLPKADGCYANSSNNLSGDYTTWTSGALSDFNGKANTAAIQAASDTDRYTDIAYMGTYCTKFNATATENQGYTDWYIPACGQLALMYLNKDDINAALTKIGGIILAGFYWSSSESWLVYFYNGIVNNSGKDCPCRVRFVRDF